MTYKLLFVCLGNICRSPTAENIMNYLLDQACEKNRLRLCWYSWVSHRKPPDERMAAAAASQLGKLKVAS